MRLLLKHLANWTNITRAGSLKKWACENSRPPDPVLTVHMCERDVYTVYISNTMNFKNHEEVTFSVS